MKKKITFLVCSLLLAFALTACGSKGPVKYGDYTAEDLEQSSESLAQNLIGIDESQVKEYSDYYADQVNKASGEDAENAKMMATLMSDWAETRPLIGDFVGFSDFKVEKTGKTLTTTLTMDFSDRDAKLVTVYKTYNMKVSSVNAEPVYTMGETMKKAGLNVLIGIGTVFVMLILISLLISCFKIIPYLQKKFSKAPEAKDTEKAEEAAAPVSAAAGNDEELVAVIAAAIAAGTGESTDSFVVRSIRRRY